MATSAGIKAGKAFVLIEAVDKTSRILRRVEARFRQFGAKIQSLGQQFLTRTIAALVPIGLSVKTFASFDDSMRKVQARSAGTAEEMEALREQAKELGRTTSFTASQVGELQAKLAQKGFNRSQILAMTEGVMSLARAGGEGTVEDPTLAADLVASALRQFQASAEDSARFADIFTAAVNNSSYSLDGLLTSMKYAGPIAHRYNLSLEDTVTTLGSMTNLGLDAEMAGTAFRNMLLRMSDKSLRDQFNKTLKTLTGKEVNMTDAAGNLRKPAEVLWEITEAIEGLGTAEQGDILSKLFGARAVVPAGALGDAKKGFQELAQAINNHRGLAKKTAKEMDSGIGGSFRNLLSAVEGVQIAIGEALSPELIKLSNWITAHLGSLTEWISRNRKLVVRIVGLVAGLSLLGAGLIVTSFALKTFAFGIGIVAVLITLLKVSAGVLIAVFSGPFGVVIAAVSAVIALLYKFSNSFQQIANDVAVFVSSRFSDMGNSLVSTIKGIVKAISSGNLQNAWSIMVEGMALTWNQFVDSLHDAWDSFCLFFVEAGVGAMLVLEKTWLSLQKKIAVGLFKLGSKPKLMGNILEKAFETIPFLPGFTKTMLAELGANLSQSVLSNILGVDLSKTSPDTLGQYQKTIEDMFGSKIEHAEDQYLRFLKNWKDGINEENRLRDLEVQKRKESLQKELEALNTRIQAEEGINNTLDDLEAEYEKKAKNLKNNLQPKAGTLPYTVVRGLERGSVEAFTKFHENRRMSILQKQLAIQEMMKGLLENIRDNTDDMNDIEVV